MSKKAKEVPAPVPIIGRVSSHLKMGIVGMPNVGKSTTFNVLTKLSIPAENYPFCTIDPNKARVPVPDERWEWLSTVFKPKSKVQAFLEIVDIAGLVKGASQGQGLGNAFLSHINAVDGIYHVCRIFENDEITHVEGSIDPLRDFDIIHEELLLKDIEHVSKKMEAMKRVALSDKNKKIEYDILEKILNWMEKDRKEIRFGEWNAKDVDVLNSLNLLTAKPVIYLINMGEEEFVKQKNRWLPKIKTWVESKSGDPIIPFSAAFEARLANMTQEEADAYCKANKTRSMLPRIIKVGFNSLNLMNFFTCGEAEVRAWTVHRGVKAPQAAGTIHTDFEKKFISADVMHYDDLRELGSENAVRAAGKLMMQGKNYVVEDGDIMHFKHNAGGGKK